MKYIFVFIGLFLFFSLQAQESANQTTEAVPTAQPEEITVDADGPETDETVVEAVNKETEIEEVKKEDTTIETKPNFDVFNPSEDISEDLAVPFPVDI